MHILIIPSWYSSDENPVLGSFFKEQAIALKDNGFKITVAYTETKSMFSKDVFDFCKYGYKKSYETDVSTYRYKALNYLPLIKNGTNFIIYKKLDLLLKKIIEDRGKPDVIHLHSFVGAGYAVEKLSRKYKIPYVITEHHTGFSRGIFSENQLSVLKKVLEQSEEIIAVGRGLYNDLKEYTSKEISIIPNMVDINKFKKMDIYKKDNNCFYFLSVGFLTYKKGFDILIKALSRLNMLDVKLLIGGDGEERVHLENLVKDLGLEERVEFLGALSREEVNKYMNVCDAFVLPSRHETFGVVFIEALAVGKPIIASSCEGPLDIVNENNGLIVPIENTAELAKAMKYLFFNRKEYDEVKIRTDCINKYSNEAVIEKLASLYQRVLKKNSYN
ncbi:glycosyltransferase [Mesobacillus selenatarsenatis]|uniref:Putative teichuronic acid biosynthesis glycosyl transferase TuaC n=1 Tax=Mesobacillus selenatarsenatis (strain DSM 18680 / JCM 14380 / FERM P-15431 / SF-1) TaxID=1321606 RepID=A0A0A8XAC9_MESS1|nr:glycosyltransferase [Mesobacillus selenatarsenatis]GAM16239.1 putative teichuronic acid biosynthesis glycosyl transferase TuaC [Mesobacillus selenatarsenatis SF-1]